MPLEQRWKEWPSTQFQEPLSEHFPLREPLVVEDDVGIAGKSEFVGLRAPEEKAG